MRDQSIERLMTTPAWTIGPEATLADAASIMARQHIHHLPVVDGDQLVGMVSAADLAGPEAPRSVPRRIGEVMRREPVAIRRHGTLAEAAECLARGGYHALPVVDADRRVVGMLTSTDLVRILLRELPGWGTGESAGPPAPGTTAIAALERVRQAADVYLRSGHGEHEHAALTRALEKARELLGPGLPVTRL